MNNVIGFLLIIFISCSLQQVSGDLNNEEELLKQIYSKSQHEQVSFIRPFSQNGTTGPVIIRVNLHIRSITEIDEINMNYKIQVTFRQEWFDNRFAFNIKNQTYITLQDSEKIWVPDGFFLNEVEAHFHNVMTPNELIRIKPDGEILYSTRLSLKLQCTMDFSNFPLDKQTCYLVFASYAYTTKDLVFFWDSIQPVQVSKRLNLPNFEFSKFKTDYCTSRTMTGEYSCLKLEINFHRKWNIYLLKVYLPFALLVMLSWITFWLDHKATTARVSVLFSILLVIVLMSSNIPSTISHQSCTTAIDVWIAICWTFLFAAIIEFALVSQAALKGEKKSLRVISNGTKKCEPSNKDFILKNVGNLLKEYSSNLQKIDGISRIAFPIAFGVFNVIYWITYATSG